MTDPIDTAAGLQCDECGGDGFIDPSYDDPRERDTDFRQSAADHIDPIAVLALAAEIRAELTRASAKFPGKNVTFAALVKEVGELANALFEAVQVAVMAMRLVLDGDHCFDEWRREHDLDHLEPAVRERHSPAATELQTEIGAVMSKFRKKPVVVEAIRYTGDNLGEVLQFTGRDRRFDQWFRDFDDYAAHVADDRGVFKIFTLEGTMEASPGDWIIRGVQGEHYPCKPDIFEATYEPVQDDGV